MAKSTWNNKPGNRDRQPIAVLVTEDGSVHRFRGASLDGVCHAVEVDYTRSGKWSNSTFEITHRPSTVLVSWMQDWDRGQYWPQASWDEAFAWLATQAPGVSRDGFEAFVRGGFPKTAEAWDAAAAACDEFDTSLPLEHAADTAKRLAAIEAAEKKLEAAADRHSRAAGDLQQAMYAVRRAVDALAASAERNASVRREADAAAAVLDCVKAEATAAEAEAKRFTAGAFDALAGLKL